MVTNGTSTNGACSRDLACFRGGQMTLVRQTGFKNETSLPPAAVHCPALKFKKLAALCPSETPHGHAFCARLVQPDKTSRKIKP